MNELELKYRKDLDGLRALSILAVILYHVKIKFIGGGFLGVDVFFVISGYLISKIIISRTQDNTFRFSDFYFRRIRRLFPALFFVIVCALIYGYLYYEPEKFIALAQSAVSASLSYSNIHFWHKFSYFFFNADTHPLLHTWSLSVEEQFYLIWPLFIWVLFTLNPKKVCWIVITVVSSLSLLSFMWSTSADYDTAFYMMHNRIFQFGIGALAVFAEQKLPKNFSKFKYFKLIALVALTACFVLFDRFDFLYGLPSLLVSCFTFILLISKGSKIDSAILENKFSIWVGKISYSLYLVHVPLTANYIANEGNYFEYHDQIYLILSFFATGALLHYYIENPFRLGKIFFLNKSKSRQFAAVALCISSVLASSAYVIHKNGLPTRISNSFVKFWQEPDRSFIPSEAPNFCVVSGRKKLLEKCQFLDKKRKTIILAGDSHALDLAHGFASKFPDHNVIDIYEFGCQRDLTSQEKCRKFIQNIDNVVNKNNLDIEFVILHNLLSAYDDLVPYKGSTTSWTKYVQELTKTHKQIIIGPRMFYSVRPIDLYAKLGSLQEANREIQRHAKWYLRDKERKIEKFAKNAGVEYISFLNYNCSQFFCSVLDENNKLLYRDHGHLTPTGINHYISLMIKNEPVFRKLKQAESEKANSFAH